MDVEAGSSACGRDGDNTKRAALAGL